MSASRVILVGSGHLSHRIAGLITAAGAELVELPHEPPSISERASPRFESTVRRLRDLDFTTITAAYLVDDRDEINLEALVALLSVDDQLPIVVTLFNEHIAPHLQAANPNVRVLNPARIAAPAFLDALNQPIARALRYTVERRVGKQIDEHGDRLILRLSIAFALMLAIATTYFHVAERLAWIDALYFVVVTVATVGYGDINLLASSTMSKVAGIGLIIGSTCFIWMIFSLTVDRLVKRRVQLALGRRTYTLRDHIVVCGLGRLGYFIAEGLIARGERVLVVERDEHATTIENIRALGADVYIGDARLPRVLQAIGVMRAKALYAVINNDFVNLEIGLSARTFEPNLRLVLRIFDDAMAAHIRDQLDIHLSMSMTAIADEKVYNAMPALERDS
jgi:voltage-gated potassium channel Kch